MNNETDREKLVLTLEKCERLEQDLNNVIGILLRVSPEHEDYVRVNFPNYFKELNNDKAN